MEEKIFELGGKRYHFMECTAVAECDGYEEARQHALFCWYEAPCPGDTDRVFFGWNTLPEDIEDVENILSDESAEDGYCETLDTVRFADGSTYREWNHNYCR